MTSFSFPAGLWPPLGKYIVKTEGKGTPEAPQGPPGHGAEENEAVVGRGLGVSGGTAPRRCSAETEDEPREAASLKRQEEAVA